MDESPVDTALDGRDHGGNVCNEIASMERDTQEYEPAYRALLRNKLLLLREFHCGIDTRAKGEGRRRRLDRLGQRGHAAELVRARRTVPLSTLGVAFRQCRAPRVWRESSMLERLPLPKHRQGHLKVT
jgi:hypothetical protein